MMASWHDSRISKLADQETIDTVGQLHRHNYRQWKCKQPEWASLTDHDPDRIDRFWLDLDPDGPDKPDPCCCLTDTARRASQEPPAAVRLSLACRPSTPRPPAIPRGRTFDRVAGIDRPFERTGATTLMISEISMTSSRAATRGITFLKREVAGATIASKAGASETISAAAGSASSARSWASPLATDIRGSLAGRVRYLAGRMGNRRS